MYQEKEFKAVNDKLDILVTAICASKTNDSDIHEVLTQSMIPMKRKHSSATTILSEETVTVSSPSTTQTTKDPLKQNVDLDRCLVKHNL